MANMSYCRWENTLNDLRDCAEHVNDPLGGSEARADQERAEFEAAYAEKLRQVLPAANADRMIEWRLSRKGDGYEDREVDEAWWGWQAALAKQGGEE